MKRENQEDRSPSQRNQRKKRNAGQELNDQTVTMKRQTVQYRSQDSSEAGRAKKRVSKCGIG